MQTEEERQWAIQQEANRQLMLQNEIELSERQRQMAMMLKTQHKGDKVQKERFWTNAYGEQIPLPEVWYTLNLSLNLKFKCIIIKLAMEESNQKNQMRTPKANTKKKQFDSDDSDGLKDDIEDVNASYSEYSIAKV